MPIKKSLIIALGFLAFVPALYFYIQYQKVHRQLQNPTMLVSQEAKELLVRVGQLMVLPEGEEPTVATVSDKEKLKDQPFFDKAKNGDKLIIYPNARKAILYDPVADKIIDIVSLNIATPSPVAQAPIRLVLYNGTTTEGLTKTVQEDLTGKIGDFEVVARENASKKDYPKTLVIDLIGTKEDLVQEITKILEGETSSLPEGETKPEAEILIIVGANYLQ